MDSRLLIDGLTMYLGLLALLTFHEFGHAWMAWRCGDDTAKLQGRCSLNPLVHIDPIGTVLLPLVMIFLPGAGQFLVGWARPVPVNAHNLRNPRWDDILVSLAGPWMNLLLAVALMAMARASLVGGSSSLTEFCLRTAHLSLVLCFFNLIPLPPLDGSHVLRHLTGMSYETYAKFARFGFIAVILVIQFPFVQHLLDSITQTSLSIIAGWFGIA
jgi:Zn-dependent protease